MGAQTDGLELMSTGVPIAKTRVAGVVNWPLTHGPLAADGGGSVQPATT